MTIFCNYCIIKFLKYFIFNCKHFPTIVPSMKLNLTWWGAYLAKRFHPVRQQELVGATQLRSTRTSRSYAIVKDLIQSECVLIRVDSSSFCHMSNLPRTDLNSVSNLYSFICSCAAHSSCIIPHIIPFSIEFVSLLEFHFWRWNWRISVVI